MEDRKEDRLRRMPFRLWLVRVLQGAVIGAGAILPGVSGGVLCVSFGLYRPLMQLLAHPLQNLKRYARLFLPVGIGWALGFLLFAKLLDVLFQASEAIGTCLFIGMIAGTFPSLWKEACREGRSRGSWIGLGVSFCLMLGFFLTLNHVTGIQVTPNWGWYVFCGVMWGLSLVIPGLTSSSLLIFLGLYQPLLKAANTLDLSALLPMGLGVAVSLAASVRAVDHFFTKHYRIAGFCVLGFVFATTVAIIPTSFTNRKEALLCAALSIGGFFAAWGMERYGKKQETRKAENDTENGRETD